METILAEFAEAYAKHAGYQLANTVCPETSNDMLREIWGGFSALNDPKSAIKKRIQLSTRDSWGGMVGEEAAAWADVYLGYYKTLGELLAVQDASAANGRSSWKRVYDAWNAMLSSLMRGYDKGLEAWTLPCLYMAGKHLRVFAIKADEERNSGNSVDANNPGQAFQDDFNPEEEQNQTLEECARALNRVFTMCISDRAPLEESRKWGIYHVANLLFKTYFRLNSAPLSKNILRILSAGRGDMPELKDFPKSQQVTFKYYEGVLLFLEENYVEAEQRFTDAWQSCHKDATRNKELILTYLIPCHLLTTHTLPSDRLLEPYPRLQKLFIPLSRCIRKGDLHGFDQALREGEDEFVKRRIYLTLERGRDIALRNLLRKVFVAGGFEDPKDPGAPPVRRTRVPIAEFTTAISLGSKEMLDNDEVECLLANMIYKNLMKGYIAREAGKVVLSKTGAFPGTTL